MAVRYHASMGMTVAIAAHLLPLAQQAAEQEQELPPELRSRAMAIVLLVALLGLIGVVVILLLGVTWRRYNKRVVGKKAAAAEALDPWSTAAQRAKADDEAPEDDGEGDDHADGKDDTPPPDKGPRPDTDTNGNPPVGV